MKTRFSLLARIRSFGYAFRGIAEMLRTQHNAWIHAAATVIGAGVASDLTNLEWTAITLAIVAVWTAESLNTAFESLCDVASPDFHPKVERAKDVAAGAVLISAVGAAVVGLLVFGRRLSLRFSPDRDREESFLQGNCPEIAFRFRRSESREDFRIRALPKLLASFATQVISGQFQRRLFHPRHWIGLPLRHRCIRIGGARHDRKDSVYDVTALDSIN